MNLHTMTRSISLALLLTAAHPLIAQNMDIEQADSLNFQSFHKNKKEAVKVWDKPAETTKAYSDESAATGAAAASDKIATVPPTANSGDVKGKRFELRERYALNRSAQTPYSAFYVLEPLYKQAAQLCPKGWKKLGERSEPVDADFHLYFEIECL